MEIKIYTTKNCPNCEKLKKFLLSERVNYKVVDMSTAEALTELRMNGVFVISAPVLQVERERQSRSNTSCCQSRSISEGNEDYLFLTYDELFNGEELKKERIKEVIGDEEKFRFESKVRTGEKKRDLI